MKIGITGAASGIIASTYPTLFKKGHFLYLTTHTKKEASRLKENLSGHANCIVTKCDVTSTRDIKKFPLKELDCLVLNAAIGFGGSILDAKMIDIKKTYDINVFANINLARTYIKKRKETHQKGKIVLISSLITKIPIPFLGIYSSSKASTLMIFKTLINELKKDSSIQLKIVLPGAYHTGFNQAMIQTNASLIIENSLFYSQRESIDKKLHTLFSLMEKKKLNSIEHKIESAILDSSSKIYYAAPISSILLLKIYSLFTY